VRVTVQDDGKGFDVSRVASGHHGLLGMRVRLEAHAGTLTVTSAPGQGCLVSAQLPCSTHTREMAQADTTAGAASQSKTRDEAHNDS
jgi:nitrate/nitrite-specific signal transduction histidine kinase